MGPCTWRIMIVYKKLIVSTYSQSKKISFPKLNQNFLLPLLTPIVTHNCFFLLLELSSNPKSLRSIIFIFFY